LRSVCCGSARRSIVNENLLQKSLCDATSSALTPDDLHAELVEVGLARGERLALDGAAGGVVLRIDVENEPAPRVVGEGAGVPVLILKREGGERLSDFEGHGSLRLARVTGARGALRGSRGAEHIRCAGGAKRRAPPSSARSLAGIFPTSRRYLIVPIVFSVH